MQKAQKCHYEKVVKIVSERFDMTKEETEKMLYYIYDNSFVLCDKGEVMSFVAVIEFTYNGNNGAYIYSFCTDKNAQSKGYGTTLLNEVCDFYKNKADSIMLRPREESLFDFYKSRGFTDTVNIEQKVYKLSGDSVGEIKEIDFDRFYSLRKNYKEFLWSENIYKYNFDMYGYKAFEGKDFLCAIRQEKGNLYVDEFFTKNKDSDFNAILSHYKKDMLYYFEDGSDRYLVAKFWKNKENIKMRLFMH